MSEMLSPHQKPKTPKAVTYRLQSPTTPFFIGSNDDDLERARVRAARAASVHRKSIPRPPPPPSPFHQDYCFTKQQITELFQNCIRLSSENKINQKKTWDLCLIDHISEIIKLATEDDIETNYRKASCTLEAGVKIYASRVDWLHSEAYKVPGGIARAGRVDEQDEARANVSGPSPSWDDENAYVDNFDGGDVLSDVVDGPFTLVSQRRQVSKTEVKYGRTSKQVDVHVLKETLWNHIQKFPKLHELDLKMKKIIGGGMNKVDSTTSMINSQLYL